MSITEQVLDLEQRRVAATNAADAGALAEILAEDYVHIGGTGTIMGKSAYITWVGELRREHRRANLRVVDKGNGVALIVGDLENHLHHDDNVEIVQAVVLETAVERDGRWQIHSFQITQKRSAYS